MSLVLAFDTSTATVAVGIGRDADGAHTVVAEWNVEAPRAAGATLLPGLRSLMSGLGLDASDLRAVAVGIGPGSFTGVRIAVSTAKGIAAGLGVPLFGVGTLDAVAMRLEGLQGVLGVVGDAMRGEVYPARFEWRDGRCVRLDRYSVARPEAVAAEWAAAGELRPALVVGDGLAKHAREFEQALPGAVPDDGASWHPTGASLLRAFWALEPGDRGDGEPSAVLPVYTRLSDAEENERRRPGCAAVPGDEGAGERAGT